MLNKELLLMNHAVSADAYMILGKDADSYVTLTAISALGSVVSVPLFMYAGGGSSNIHVTDLIDTSMIEGIVYVTNALPAMTLLGHTPEIISMAFVPYVVPDVGAVKRALISPVSAGTPYTHIINTRYFMKLT